MRASFLLLAALLQAVPAYRLLSARESPPAAKVREFDFNISVEKYLEVDEARSLICAVVRDQKPQAYEVLSIGIYYKLERHTATEDGEGASDAELREHRLVQYHWSKDAPKDNRRLVITRDAKGQILSTWRFLNFDHSRSCR